MKIDVTIQDTKSLRGFRQAHKFRLRIDASLDTRCSWALYTKLSRVIDKMCALNL